MLSNSDTFQIEEVAGVIYLMVCGAAFALQN